MDFKIILLLLCLTCLSMSYTIIGDQKTVFPSQRPNPRDSTTFLRLDSRQHLEVLSCPDKFVFDEVKLKCVFSGSDHKGNADKFCPDNLRGTLPYKKNCRFYVSCWDGAGAIQKCGLNLLFNEYVGHCDYPEKANCCEFKEKNASVLV